MHNILEEAVQDAFMLKSLLRTIEHFEQEICTLNTRLQYLMSDYTPIFQELDRIPDINEVTARGILAEIGPYLEAFPSDGQLTSWADGICQ